MAKTIDEIKSDVLTFITKDSAAAEFQIAIFSAALISYRKDSCLRPFPEFLQNLDVNNGKDIAKLEEVFKMIPPLDDILRGDHIYSDDVWKLLHWMLKSKTFTTSHCQKSLLNDLQEKTGHSSFVLQPDFIFEVKYHTNASQNFDEQIQQYGLKYGYHGSRMDNFYSIVSNGLQVHMMKNGLFGDGIYLCEDLAVTMPYVSGGNIWKHSKLGEQISCVAVCEILDHPAVKYQVSKEEDNKKRSTAENSQCGEVPDKYFVVTKSDLLRIKYLLVFLDKKSDARKKHKREWLCIRYPVASVLFIYVLFLILMGIWKSRTFQQYLKKNWNPFNQDD